MTSDQLPFMEHPTGEFDTALQAILSAMQRLANIDMNDRWITFNGQGYGGVPDTYNIADVRLSGNTFDLGSEKIDYSQIMERSGLKHAGIDLVNLGNGRISIPKATPEQLARFLDQLFKIHFNIRPFPGESDYAVGAEWINL